MSYDIDIAHQRAPKSSPGKNSTLWWLIAVISAAAICLIGLTEPRVALRAAVNMGVLLAAILVLYGMLELIKRLPTSDNLAFRPDLTPAQFFPEVPTDVLSLQAPRPDSRLTPEAAKAITDIATERLWAHHQLNLYNTEHHETIRSRVSPGLWYVFSSTQNTVSIPTHQYLDQLLDELEGL